MATNFFLMIHLPKGEEPTQSSFRILHAPTENPRDVRVVTQAEAVRAASRPSGDLVPWFIRQGDTTILSAAEIAGLE